MERKNRFAENWLIFCFLGEAELILRLWGTKAKYSQGSENWVEQCIIVREQGSTDPSSRGLIDHWVQ